MPARAREFAARVSRAFRDRAAWNRAARECDKLGSRITAAATTGPKSDPRPTSSTPATSFAPAVPRQLFVLQRALQLLQQTQLQRGLRNRLFIRRLNQRFLIRSFGRMIGKAVHHSARSRQFVAEAQGLLEHEATDLLALRLSQPRRVTTKADALRQAPLAHWCSADCRAPASVGFCRAMPLVHGACSAVSHGGQLHRSRTAASGASLECRLDGAFRVGSADGRTCRKDLRRRKQDRISERLPLCDPLAFPARGFSAGRRRCGMWRGGSTAMSAVTSRSASMRFRR